MVVVRRACEDDVDGFIKCYTSVWKSFRSILPDSYIDEVLMGVEEPTFKDSVKLNFTNPERILIVAEQDQAILGHAQGNFNKGGYSWLNFIGVEPNHRRSGIGKALLNKFIEESKAFGCTKVSLNTAPCLKEAIKMYAEMGFVPEGYMKNHMHGLDLIFYSLFFD